ncbi:uncharacterized protein LOC120700292 isoform X2 [Panicum virgatum]|uniref:uncharacterized protein LOC120700292 isoform X2 n=1 Tax=Panicum virgatum TaxID=38727 RepID=UPI0019D57120|nr:uncharacterized protein LOC120700292 isoform X2 [Panicum virgatum]
MEALLTLLFNALLLVFVVKLFFALFHMKLVVILLYIAVLLFAMALTGRFPASYILIGDQRREDPTQSTQASCIMILWSKVNSDGILLDALADVVKVGEQYRVDATSEEDEDIRINPR